MGSRSKRGGRPSRAVRATQGDAVAEGRLALLPDRRTRGAESAMLGVDGGNTAAVGLYRSAGFGVVGMTDSWERSLRGRDGSH